MIRTTLGDLLAAINDATDNQDEALAAIVHLANSGAVRLGKRQRRVHIDLGIGARQIIAA